MNWETRFAQRTAAMPRNTVREFLKHAARPGVVSFAGGLPAPELFPIDAFASAAERALERHGAKALQYGLTEGLPELRGHLAERFGAPLENVLITTGAQQALEILGRVLLDAEDTVLVENPTYLSLLTAWRPLGVHFRGIEMDDDGLFPESVVSAMAARPKLLYTMPNFHNPSGATLTAERRQELAAIAQQHDLPLIEDDAYGDLRFDGEPLPRLYDLAEGKVVYVGTFSKTLAPGLRVGWMVAPRELIEFCVRAKQAIDLQTGSFSQYVTWELIQAGVIDAQLPILRREYRARCKAMIQALEREMPPGVTWSAPMGGMFLLLRLPEGCPAARLSQAALRRDVLVVPGDDFHVANGQNTLRLNFSNASEERIREGIGRLGEIAREQAVTWQNAMVG